MGEFLEHARAPEITSRIAHVRHMHSAVAQPGHRQGGPDAVGGVNGLPAANHLLIHHGNQRGKIPVTLAWKALGLGVQLHDGLLGRLGPAGQAANAVGHGEEAKLVVPQIAVLVFFADFADIGEGGGTETHGVRGDASVAVLKRKAEIAFRGFSG